MRPTHSLIPPRHSITGACCLRRHRVMSSHRKASTRSCATQIVVAQSKYWHAQCVGLHDECIELCSTNQTIEIGNSLAKQCRRSLMIVMSVMVPWALAAGERQCAEVVVRRSRARAAIPAHSIADWGHRESCARPLVVCMRSRTMRPQNAWIVSTTHIDLSRAVFSSDAWQTPTNGAPFSLGL